MIHRVSTCPEVWPFVSRCCSTNLRHKICRLRYDPRRRLRSWFRVKQFCQRAGVNEIHHRLVVSALLNDKVGERAGNIFHEFADLCEGWCDAAPFGKVGLALGEVLVIESVIERFDGEDDSFPIVERYGLDWADNSLVENGFHANGHGFSLSDFLEEVCSI